MCGKVEKTSKLGKIWKVLEFLKVYVLIMYGVNADLKNHLIFINIFINI